MDLPGGTSERRSSNPSPIKPRRNGSLPNVHNGSAEVSKLIRTPSNPHSQLGKKDSVMSSNSSHSDNSGWFVIDDTPPNKIWNTTLNSPSANGDVQH